MKTCDSIDDEGEFLGVEEEKRFGVEGGERLGVEGNEIICVGGVDCLGVEGRGGKESIFSVVVVVVVE